MRFLIHALGATMGGARRHLNGFLPALATAGAGHVFRVLVRETFEAVGSNNVEIHRVPDRYVTGIQRLWVDNSQVPLLARQFRADALVSLTNLGPISAGVPHVIMQRNALLFAREYWHRFGLRPATRFRLQRLLAIGCMRRAHLVITPSASMSELIRRDCPFLPADRFSVLPHAFDPSGYEGELEPETAHRLECPGVRILYPCVAGPHKGFDLLLEIGRALPESLRATIYLTGGDEDGELLANVRRKAAELGVQNRIVFLGRIRQSAMHALYRACDVLLYVSPIESFGFPVLEGLAFGIPIVAVDTPVNRELCGPAARYFVSESPRAGARAIEDALAAPDVLKEAGQAQFRSRDRSWEGYVRTLLALIESRLQEHPPADRFELQVQP